ncbi:hypothetical protein [Rubrimonas cliftonensis]|uniref:hypothetical protein n=1 Tax=Rubrimonas cliftonensis TaxID=89524 RepID=UPI001114F8CB|nr:hypothetical protein [Rubrimonas cliftonensis]
MAQRTALPVGRLASDRTAAPATRADFERPTWAEGAALRAASARRSTTAGGAWRGDPQRLDVRHTRDVRRPRQHAVGGGDGAVMGERGVTAGRRVARGRQRRRARR